MDAKAKPIKIRHVLLVLLAILIAGIAFDYTSYHSRNRRAMAAVSDLGGLFGSLLGWPLGKEYYVEFDHPLTNDKLKRLSVLNSLAGRDHVTVRFNFDLTAQQLATVRRVLSDCHVYQRDVPVHESRGSANSASPQSSGSMPNRLEFHVALQHLLN